MTLGSAARAGLGNGGKGRALCGAGAGFWRSGGGVCFDRELVLSHGSSEPALLSPLLLHASDSKAARVRVVFFPTNVTQIIPFATYLEHGELADDKDDLGAMRRCLLRALL